MKRKDNSGRVLRTGESQRKDKTYMYRWTNPNGKRDCLYARTLEELREKESEILKEVSAGVSRTNMTLNEQIQRYLSTKSTLAKSTLANYQYYYHHAIECSAIGRVRVVNIRKSDILLYYKELYDNGFRAGTIKVIHKIVHPALQLACDDNVIVKNPAEGCTRDYFENAEKKFALTYDEEEEFLDRIKQRPRMARYYPFYAILLNTGLRISEAIGLTWADVDMTNKRISVNHQVQYRKIGNKTKFYASTTKTNAGKRIIPMTEEVYSLFKKQREEWLKIDKDTDFEVDGIRDFVFLSHQTGRCLSHNSIRRMMRSIVEMNEEREQQLPPISPHILRHTRCCRWAEAGCDIKVLQYWMGQTDIRTTMQVYNHVDGERSVREMKKLKDTPNYTNFYTKTC